MLSFRIKILVSILDVLLLFYVNTGNPIRLIHREHKTHYENFFA